MSHTIYVISHVPERFPPIARSMAPQRVNYFDGTGYESFSKLVNSCVAACPTETVIIASHKVMPTNKDVSKMLCLIEMGFAFVGLCNFRFFGFKKELIRQMGPFDERYKHGGFEDYDFTVRLIEADLAAYITTEVTSVTEPSSWGDYKYGMSVWATKWHHTWTKGISHPTVLTRTLPEEKYDYNFGPSTNVKFLSSKEHSYIWPNPHVTPIYNMKIESGV